MLTQFDYSGLGIGWYHNWGNGNWLPLQSGVTFYGTVGGQGETVGQLSPAIEQNLRLHAERYPNGMVWFIGNEVGLLWDYNSRPTDFARYYHDWYVYLKGLNSTWKIGSGAILPVQYDSEAFRIYPPDPGSSRRLTGIEWLDQVRNRYQSLYGSEMPIDVYNIHAYLYPSRPGYFEQEIRHFRQAMATQWGARAKPLIITEMGSLEQHGTETVRTMMLDALDFLETATSSTYGCTTDGNLLVQKWAWYSLTGWSPTEGNHVWDHTALFDYDTRLMTPLGEAYAGYVSGANNRPPLVGAVQPSGGTSGLGQEQVFTTTFTDPDGWEDLQAAWVLINDRLTGAGSFYGYYNQNTNEVRLINDGGTGFIGPKKLGEVGAVLENSYVSLDVARMTLNGSGGEITITWPVTFKQTFGQKVCKQYLWVKDDAALTDGWKTVGSWSVGGDGVNEAPSVGVVAPSDGSSGLGQEQVFTTTFTDPDGWQDVQAAWVLINDRLTGAGAFYGYYNQNTNEVRLGNDGGRGFIGPRSLGEAGAILENSYVSLDVARMTVTGSGNTLRITWPVTFKNAFGAKTCKQYLWMKDDVGRTDGWTTVGKWVVGGDGQNDDPSVGAVGPSAGTSALGGEQVFTTTFSDPDGWQDVQAAWVLINDRLTGAGAFYGYYNQNTNEVRLGNDGGKGFIGPRSLGEAGAVLENSYVSLNVARMTVTGSGNTLRITWPVTFKSAFGVKTCKQYLWVKDDFGATDGWATVGRWSVVGAAS